MDYNKKKMTKEGFVEWCNDYAIFHHINMENSEFCAIHVMEGNCSIDREFLEFSLGEFLENYSNVDYVRNFDNRPNEHVVFINF